MSWFSQGADQLGNGLASAFSTGVPGHNTFQGQSFQNAAGQGYDPNAFQGQWNSAGSAYNPAALAGNAQAAQGKQAPGLSGQYGMGGFQAAQGGQQGLASLLMGQATGSAPSMAQAQLQQATQQNVANGMAMQAQTRGNNPAMAGYNAAQQTGQANQQAAGQGVQAGIAERQGAMAQLGNVYGTMGGQSLQAGEAGQQGQLAQNQMNNQMTQYYMSQGMNAQEAQLQAQIAQQGILANSYNQTQGLEAGAAQQNATAGGSLAGGLLGAAGSTGGSIMSALSHGGITGYPGMAFGGVSGFADAPGMSQSMGNPNGGGGGGGLSKMFTGQPTNTSAAGVTPDATAGAGDIPIMAGLAAEGTVVPGIDRGEDTSAYMLRPNEVVTPPENPLHPYVKAAQQDPAYASALAYHLMRSGVQAPTGPVHAAGGAIVGETPQNPALAAETMATAPTTRIQPRARQPHVPYYSTPGRSLDESYLGRGLATPMNLGTGG
jgi:hypothetical protein